MDLFSAARRLSRPRVFRNAADRDALGIGDHGLIGDGHTAALVRADGRLDWLCFPRFDSPSVFASILDDERGGASDLAPSSYPFETLQRYDPDTNVLETLFTVEGQGTLRVTDTMPWTDDPRAALHEVHRRVQCVEGEVEFEVRFDPRFGYGAGTVTFERNEHGVLAVGDGGERLACTVSSSAEWAKDARGGESVRVTLRAGERCWVVLSWGAPRPEAIAAYRPFEHLRTTRTAWRGWVQALGYEGPWRHHVVRSALVLKLLMYAPTGAMVAAPTTSLPEWIGGVRNWDYRYSWTRDSAMAIRAANLLGAKKEARDFFHFVRDTLEGEARLQIMYDLDGRPVPDERTLTHLRGHRDSAPVRVGNGARDQIQLDTAGALLDAAHVYETGGGSLGLRAWRKLRGVVEGVAARWTEPDHGIWEPRDGTRHNVHSKLMSWVALRRGAELARLFGDERERSRWESEAERVHADVCARGLDGGHAHFVAAYDHTHADAALLLLPITGFLPAQDPRIEATIARIRAELGDGPFLHRYRTEDGVGGAEGSFVLCGFWLAEALAMAGRLDEAQEVFVAHAEASNHLGLLAEEIDAPSGDQLGNFPQAFSHLGLINAAARIDEALKRRNAAHGEA